MNASHLAWQTLKAGNDRFCADQPQHPQQDQARRSELTEGQAPIATIFGCSDSRLPAEIVFDQGLGTLFGVRSAGNVLDGAVLGSIEYSIACLKVPLLVVLGHEKCGAVAAAASALDSSSVPGGNIRHVVEAVLPSLITAGYGDNATVEECTVMHVRQTMQLLYERSEAIRVAMDADELAIVGAIYRLSDGKVTPVHVDGTLTIPFD